MHPHAQPTALPSAEPSTGPAPAASARVGELSERWRKARLAALRATVAGVTSNTERDLPEADLTQRALALDEDAALRRVFDNSLHLGVGYARTFGVVEVDELAPLLAGLALECLTGATLTALDDEEGLLLERPGCRHGACGGEEGRRACDLTREAIGGLALGLTGVVRHARHESLGHGGARCVDLFYTDPESPRRLGSLPAELTPALEAVAASARLFDPSASLVFLGLSEDVLFYRIERPGAPCEGSDVDVRRFAVRAAARRLPQLTLLELTPASPMDRDAEHAHAGEHAHGAEHDHPHGHAHPHGDHPHGHPHQGHAHQAVDGAPPRFG